MRPALSVYPDKDSLDRAAADLVADGLSRAHAARRGTAALALSGGETPRGLFELLATPEFSARIPWSEVEVYWTDERCVAPAHPDSNYGLARRCLLSKVPVKEENIHRIFGEQGPARAATEYETRLRKLGRGCDVVVLGVGEDGHTASLFPNTAALDENNAWATAAETPKGPRVTMTFPFLDLSGDILILAAGAAKAKVVAASAEGTGPYPVLRLSPSVPPRWLVDREAALNILK